MKQEYLLETKCHLHPRWLYTWQRTKRGRARALVRSYVYSDLVPTFIQAQVGNALGLASDLRQHGFYTL
jgi:hypothetical protein